MFSELLSSEVMPNLAPSANVEKQMTTVQLVAAIARSSPQQIAPSLPAIVPGILKATQRDNDELREASLQVRSLFSIGEQSLNFLRTPGSRVSGPEMPFRDPCIPELDYPGR